MTTNSENNNFENEVIHSQERQINNFRKILRLVTIAFIAFAIIMIIFAFITISNLITAQLNKDELANMKTNLSKLYKILTGTLEEYKPDREAQNASREIIKDNNALDNDQNDTLYKILPIIKEINQTLYYHVSP